MKKVLLGLTVLFVVVSCSKSDDVVNTSTATEAISTEDLTATANMETELGGLERSLDSLMSYHDAVHQHHWDSSYHAHDSAFWHHHIMYHHEIYIHDDHHHTWVPYDSTINHQHHYHHTYPGHENDSLVIVPSHHVHDNSDNHHHGHTINQHHILDSLHHLYTIHHP